MRELILAVPLIFVGCEQHSGMTNGAFLGGAIGALAGQAIGGNTDATLLGGAIGAGAGALIGNEVDNQERLKREYEMQQAQERGMTTRRSTTEVVLNPDGTYTRTGTETTESTVRTPGYTGLP